jgi:aryl-alcohol dehydrogenase-like predicted oxidoreductase
MPLPRFTHGRTGLEITRFGIGGAYCTDPAVYRAALDAGVNYIDTAHAYGDGEDEKLLGQAIKGIPRDELVIASKTDKRDGPSARAELDQSLESLGIEYLDIIHIHFLNTVEEREQALGPGGAYEALEQARAEGKVRFIGVTGHDWEQVAKAVATGKFDTVLCWYNCALRQAESTVFEAAQEHNTGVVIMNASARGGAGGDGPAGTVVKELSTSETAPAQEQFYRYVLSHPAGIMLLQTLPRALAGCLI